MSAFCFALEFKEGLNMNEPDKPTPTEYKTIIERCFTAFNAKDRETIEGLFSSLFTFTSPYDDAIDRATYFERCWPNSPYLQDYLGLLSDRVPDLIAACYLHGSSALDAFNDRSPAAQSALQALKVETVVGDALNLTDVTNAMNGQISALVSTIGGMPQDGQRADFLGNKQLIDAAVKNRVSRFILVSSLGAVVLISPSIRSTSCKSFTYISARNAHRSWYLPTQRTDRQQSGTASLGISDWYRNRLGTYAPLSIRTASRQLRSPAI
jgi:hypothetical protein